MSKVPKPGLYKPTGNKKKVSTVNDPVFYVLGILTPFPLLKSKHGL